MDGPGGSSYSGTSRRPRDGARGRIRSCPWTSSSPPSRGPRPSPLISILVESRGHERCARDLTAVRDGPPMPLGGRKGVGLVEAGYEDVELWVPYYRLVGEGAGLGPAGQGKRAYTPKHSYPCEVDVTAATLKAK